MQILKTTDYNIFKGVVGNRKIHKPHVRELELSIQEKNMLQFNPIMVNKNMQIIDGQHRLEVTKNLNIPIYYVVTENDVALKEIKLLQTQRMWTTQDYLESYRALGNHNYTELMDFAKEYGLSIPYALLIASDEYNHPQKTMKQFRKGLFVFTDRSKAENMASLINELKKSCTDSAWKDRNFLRALTMVIEKLDQKQLLHKVETFSLALTRRANTKEYIRQFEDIINFKQSVASQVRLY